MPIDPEVMAEITEIKNKILKLEQSATGDSSATKTKVASLEKMLSELMAKLNAPPPTPAPTSTPTPPPGGPEKDPVASFLDGD